MKLWVEGFQFPAEDFVKDDLPAVIREQNEMGCIFQMCFLSFS